MARRSLGEEVLFPMRYYLCVGNAVGKTHSVVQLGSKGRVVLPAEVCEALALKLAPTGLTKIAPTGLTKEGERREEARKEEAG